MQWAGFSVSRETKLTGLSAVVERELSPPETSTCGHAEMGIVKDEAQSVPSLCLELEEPMAGNGLKSRLNPRILCPIPRLRRRRYPIEPRPLPKH